MTSLIKVPALVLALLLLSYFQAEAQTCPIPPFTTIDGPSQVTVNARPMYSLPLGDNVASTWTITPMVQLIGSGNFRTVIFPAIPRTYTLMCTPKNSCGGTAPIITKTITVVSGSPITPPVLTEAPAHACPNVSSTYKAASPPTGYTLHWIVGYIGTPLQDFDPPLVTITGNDLTLTPKDQPGQITSLMIGAYYTNGSTSSSPVQKNVYVLREPATPVISGPSSVCVNTTTSYSNTQARTLDIPSWTLLSGGTINSTGSASWTQQGTHNVQVSVTNACYSTPKTATLPVTVGGAAPLKPQDITWTGKRCLNENITFTATAIAGAQSYTWIFAGPVTNTHTSPSNTYIKSFSDAGTYTITVSASNGICNGESLSKSIDVGIAPAYIRPTGVSAACVNTNVQMTTQAIPGNTFQWNFGDGQTTGDVTGNTVTVKWPTAGLRDVFVQTKNECGQLSPQQQPPPFSPSNPPLGTFKVRVQDSNINLGEIFGASKACIGTYSYISTMDKNTVSSVAWSVEPPTAADITIPTDPSGNPLYDRPYVTWKVAGTATLKVNASNTCGASASKSYAVTIVSGTRPATPSIDGDASACLFSQTTYSPVPNNVPGVSYVWQLGSGGSLAPVGNNATVTWSSPVNGKHLVMVTPRNAQCDGLTQNLTVYTKTVGNISYQNPSVCQGATSLDLSHFISTPPTDDPPSSYRIDWNDQANAAGLVDVPFTTTFYPLTLAVPPTAGVFQGTLYLKGETGCESSGKPLELTVNALPTISLSAAPKVCSGATSTTISFSVTGTPSEYRIDWNATANGLGLQDVAYTTLPQSTITISGIPSTVTQHVGTIYLKNTTTGCESAGQPITLDVNGLPVITPSAELTLCTGTSSGTVNYTATGSPNQYYIDWNAAANSAGLNDVPLTTLPATKVTISGIPVTVGRYTGLIFGKNTTTGCVSGTGKSIYVNVNPKPSITMGTPPEVCSGVASSSLSYTNPISTPNQYRIDWNSAANAEGMPDVALTTLPASAIPISNIPVKAGTYSGNLYVRGTGAPCEGNAIPVVVIVKSLPSPTISGNLTPCPGVEIVYTTEANMSNYLWDIIGGQFVSGAGTSAVTVKWENIASASLSITYRNPTTGCSPAIPKTQTISVKQSAPAVISGPAGQCVGAEGAYSTASGMTNYVWTTSGTIVNGQGTENITISWPQTGAQTISVSLTGQNGCAVTSPTKNVNVSSLPATGVTATATHLCPGNSTTLTSQAVGPSLTYLWKYSNGKILPVGSETQRAITTPLAGLYSLTITDTLTGCSVSPVGDIRISATKATIQVPGSLPACSATLMSNVGAFPDLTATYTYKWERYTTAWQNVYGGANLTTTVAGKYRLTITDSRGCVSVSSDYILDLLPNPTPTITASGDVCTATKVLTSSVAPSYLWSNGKTTRSISVGSGSYSVTITQSNGCSNTAGTYVSACGDPCGPTNVSSTTVGPCSGSEREVVNTRVADMSVFPNPVDNVLYVQVPEICDSDVPVTLVSQLGSVVLRDAIRKGSNNAAVETTSLPEGIYFVRIQTAKGTAHKKILIVRE